MYLNHLEMLYETQQAQRSAQASSFVRGLTTVVSVLFLGLVLGLICCLGGLLPASLARFSDLVFDVTQAICFRGYHLFQDVVTGSLTTTDGMMLTMIAIVVLAAVRSALRTSKIYAL